ncbi:16S rRNA (adenine(1518)-N(6)/adenine(1519)-N(6))-dimethyltransferase, partial [Vibrio parahaemolyticus]|uniref:rRNA adenine N-6-methyltransferase family protein n=1 Tax=Vibrio parahaemolyticus TaxID=670 RepID=UPI0027D3221C
VIAGDALAIDWTRIVEGPAQLVANLPYNIATPLLIGWLGGETWPPWWRRLTLMFQKEVADRLIAAPGSQAYGRLSILVQ